MDLGLAKRLRELRKKKHFSQAFVAEKLSISQAAYSLIENSQNCINTDHVKKLSALYNVTTDYIITGRDNFVAISPSNGFVPLIKLYAQGGFIKNPTDQLFHEETEWFKIPGFNPTSDHRLFEVEGNSMAPTVFSGDILVCQKVKNWDRILDGSIVVLMTSDSLLVKRIHRTTGKEFKFECDNPAEGVDFTISESEIKELSMVRGKISSILVPHHQVTSMGKVQNLERRIEFLEKEIFTTLKKIRNEPK